MNLHIMILPPVFFLCFFFLLYQQAHAGTAIAISYPELVRTSEAIAMVFVEKKSCIQEKGYLSTLNEVVVVKPISDNLKEGNKLTIKTRGGEMGDLRQNVPGEATFVLQENALVFLTRDSHQPCIWWSKERAQGTYHIMPKGKERVLKTGDVDLLFALVPPSSGLSGQSNMSVIPATQQLEGRSVADSLFLQLQKDWHRLHKITISTSSTR
ncbi:hypothetical protein BCY86_06270 [Pajaroellobacter abortibovis]|uniref:Uncharacterized protein n=1 Tax=Pajaroellobacter abortibovis TaxID=1882918 RepID=A0A1L6MXS1_9BACT|nr:hypothetical protein BCY86_06270 [Pajaroellobacter abortibovis]